MHDESKPQVQAEVQLPDNNPEGQMAKADLYRAAKMAIKLFQMIQDGQDLEEWVQAKLTKSADYLDSIYHYMEYQMKFGGGSNAVASIDDITAELDTLSPANAERSEEDDEPQTKMDESMNYTEKLQALLEGAMKKSKPDFLDMDKDGNKKEPMKKAVADKKKKPVAEVSDATLKSYKAKADKEVVGHLTGEKDSKNVMKRWKGADKAQSKLDSKVKEADEKRAPAKKTERETTLPSGAKIKTTKVQGWQSQRADKEAKKSRDIEEGWDDMMKANKEREQSKGTGKFDKKTTSTGTQYTRKSSTFSDGGDDKDTKNAKKKAKSVKEESLVKTVVKRVVEASKKAKPDFLDMDKDGNKKEPMKKAVADKKAVKESVVTESTDLSRMKQLMKRLNG